MKKSFSALIYTLLFANSLFAQSLIQTSTPKMSLAGKSPWRQVEVATARYKTQIAGAWAEQQGPYGQPMRCAYGIFDQKNNTWNYISYHRNDGFDFSANPSISFDQQGTLHLICMSVKADYSSGILEYSSSIDGGKTWSPFVQVAKVLNGIPDKPWIKADDNGNIVVVFAEIYIHKPMNLISQTKFIQSNNGGYSWSEPASISAVPQLSLSPIYDGFQGQWIEKHASKWELSFAEYGGGGVYYCNDDVMTAICDKPTLIAHQSLNAPITQIVHGTANELAVLWYSAHDFKSVEFSISRDNGKTWASPISITNSGSLAFGLFVKGQLLILYTDKNGSTVQTHLNRYNADGKFFQQIPLGNSDILASDAYVGAYQSMVTSENSDEIILSKITYSGVQKIETSALKLNF